MAGRSERVRGRGILTGSTITGGSSISAVVLFPLLVLVLLVSGGVSDNRLVFSSLSLSLIPRNLLPLRGVFVGAVLGSGDVGAELPLAMLLVLVLPLGSINPFDRSRVDCF